MTAENAGLSSRRRRDKEISQEQLKPDRYSRRFSELLTVLDRRGLIEAAKGALEDEDTFSSLVRLFSSNDALSIIQNAKSIIKLLSIIDYDVLNDLVIAVKNEKQAVAGLKSLVRLTNALESRGLIEPLTGLLNDEKTFAEITKLLSSDASLLFINNLQNIVMLSNALDPQFLNIVTRSVDALKGEVKPVRGLRGVLHVLGDPAVAAGLGKLFAMLRALGEDTSAKK